MHPCPLQVCPGWSWFTKLFYKAWCIIECRMYNLYILSVISNLAGGQYTILESSEDLRFVSTCKTVTSLANYLTRHTGLAHTIPPKPSSWSTLMAVLWYSPPILAARSWTAVFPCITGLVAKTYNVWVSYQLLHIPPGRGEVDKEISSQEPAVLGVPGGDAEGSLHPVVASGTDSTRQGSNHDLSPPEVNIPVAHRLPWLVGVSANIIVQ